MTVSNTNKAVSGFTRPLTYGTEFTAGLATDTGVGTTILEIRPLVPLQPSAGPATPTDPLPAGTGYLVLLTNGIQMANGTAATADRDYATIKTTLGPTINPANCATLPNAPMQGACGFTASHFAVAANPALGPAGAQSRERHRLVPLHDAWRRATRCARSGSPSSTRRRRRRPSR